MARLYDLMLLLDPNAPEERQTQIVDQVRSMIQGEGNIVGEHDWGLRKLAWHIGGRRFYAHSPSLERTRSLRHNGPAHCADRADRPGVVGAGTNINLLFG